jgi:hypothetical protein
MERCCVRGKRAVSVNRKLCSQEVKWGMDRSFAKLMAVAGAGAVSTTAQAGLIGTRHDERTNSEGSEREQWGMAD